MRRVTYPSLHFLLSSTIGYLRVLTLLALHALSTHLPRIQVEHPLKISWIDPDEITAVTGREGAVDRRWVDASKTVGGDWDRHVVQISADKWYDALRSRYEEQSSWTEIDEVQTTIRRTKDGDVKWHGCRSPQDVRERCEQLDRIYKTIRNEGYKSQAELGWGADPDEISLPSFTNFKTYYDEIAVDVARDGTLLFVDGRHRFALAKFGRVERIPVRIVVRHERWKAFRDELRALIPGRSRHRFLHPDLQEVPHEHDSDRWFDAIEEAIHPEVDTVLEINGGMSGYFCYRFAKNGLSGHSMYVDGRLYSFHREHTDTVPLSHTPHWLPQFSPSSIEGTVAMVITDPSEIETNVGLWKQLDELDVKSIFFNANERSGEPETHVVMDEISRSNTQQLLAVDGDDWLYQVTF